MDSKVQLARCFENLNYVHKMTRNVEFEQCTFIHCDFSDGGFASCKFVDCTFTHCNFSNAGLGNSQLKGVSFVDCKLMGVNFGECSDFLFSVGFKGCMLDYASFTRKKMMKTVFSDSSLKGVDFSFCDLSKSKFDQVDLMDAIFEKAILKEADLRYAINFIIDPEQTNLRKAKFSQQGLAGLLSRYDLIIE